VKIRLEHMHPLWFFSKERREIDSDWWFDEIERMVGKKHRLDTWIEIDDRMIESGHMWLFDHITMTNNPWGDDELLDLDGPAWDI